MRINRLNTMVVEMNGSLRQINRADFDPTKHKIARAKLKDEVAEPATEPGEDAYSVDALMGMSIGKIKKLPEFAKISNPASISNKRSLVDAILSVRAKTKA